MLGTLLKYDMKALSRVLGPVNIAVVAAGIATVLAFLLTDTIADAHSGPNDQFLEALLTMLSLTAIACEGVLTISPCVVAAMAAHRFYTNLFTDEGYLTLTLPVRASAVVLSKLFASLLWAFVNMVIVVVLLLLAEWAGTGFSLEYAPLSSFSVSGVVLGIVAGSFALPAPLLLLVAMLKLVCYAFFTLACLFMSFALGAAAKRHKVASGIAIFFGISWGVGALVVPVVAFALVALASAVSFGGLWDLLSFVWPVGSFALGVVFTAVCVNVVGRHTNLS